MAQQLPQAVATPLAETDYFIGGTSMTCNNYDLMYFDDTQLAPLNAASMPDQGTEAKNQRFFAERFRGVSRDKKLAGDSADNTNGPFSLGIFPDFTGWFSCPSNTFEVGDLVAVRENSTTNGLQANVVTKTTDYDAAIGEVVQKSGNTAATQVLVRLRRPINPPARNIKESPFGSTADTSTSTLVLTTASRRIQISLPTATVTCTLPLETASFGREFLIFNRSAGQTMNVYDSFTSNQVGQVGSASGKLFLCEATLGTWLVFPQK